MQKGADSSLHLLPITPMITYTPLHVVFSERIERESGGFVEDERVAEGEVREGE